MVLLTKDAGDMEPLNPGGIVKFLFSDYRGVLWNVLLWLGIVLLFWAFVSFIREAPAWSCFGLLGAAFVVAVQFRDRWPVRTYVQINESAAGWPDSDTEPEKRGSWWKNFDSTWLCLAVWFAAFVALIGIWWIHCMSRTSGFGV